MGGPCKIGLTPETIKSIGGDQVRIRFPRPKSILFSRFLWLSTKSRHGHPRGQWRPVGGSGHRCSCRESFGSALHVETYAEELSWAFCLNAPPHFYDLQIDHVAEPDGLKAQVRQVFQDAMFREGIRFNETAVH